MKNTFLSVLLAIFTVVAFPVSVTADPVSYPDVTVSGGFQSGHFDDIWDLTTGDITVSFTYDATGMVDDFGGATAHAWSELGVRSQSTNSDFNPYPVIIYWQKSVDLMAGQNSDVGDMLIQRVGDYLYIKYIVTEEECFLNETHLAVASNLDGIPQTKKGNPIPGQFEYKMSFDPPVREYEYMIPMTSGRWPSGTKLYIAAQAALSCGDSAWAWKTGDFEGANWATYVTYKPTANPSTTTGSGIWIASDYHWAPNTFDPDPIGQPTLDMDDKIILQPKGGWDEGYYNLPSSPTQYGNNYGFWFDRDGVDQWQALMWGCINGGTYNTGGVYNIVMTLHCTSATTGTAYMTVNGIPQGFYNGPWYNGQPAIYNAGQTFTGDMKHLQVFYGIYGYGTTHTAKFTNITITQ